MTALDESFLKTRFPKIYETCRYYGLDIAKDPLPVSPASHYCMGGIRTDIWGRSTLPGLYAAGEVACTGVHGANRLASNSLLEGLVFGARAGAAAAGDSSKFQVPGGRLESEKVRGTWNLELGTGLSTAVKKRIKRVMWERVGILRDGDSLRRAIAEFDQIASGNLSTSSRNFATLARLVAAAALWREESRGGHFRNDFPNQSPEWQSHSIQQLGKAITAEKIIDFARKTVV
jgi:L-aspartate oxidase